MPTPTIPQGSQYFNISLSNTGTTSGPGAGVAKVISGLAFQPDMVWSKNRSSSTNARWGLIDSVRGVNNTLSQNNTFADVTSQTDLLTSFNSNGVNIGADAGGYGWNYNQQSGTSDNYAYWLWKAGGTAVTNTSGTISSQVSANTTSGFSVVTYTGTGSIATIGHGLGVAPAMMIIKARNAVQGWLVYHQSIGNTGFVYLNGTNDANYSINGWNNTSPTSSVFTTGVNGYTNQSGQTQVAYCWSEIAGFSKFGSYTGNGSADGPFIYTGFRPRFLLIKRTDTTGDWWLEDTSRNTYNAADLVLFPNTSGAESGPNTYYWDFLSNGFKLRSTSTGYNASGGTYIYAAFAENPFKYANAR